MWSFDEFVFVVQNKLFNEQSNETSSYGHNDSRVEQQFYKEQNYKVQNLKKSSSNKLLSLKLHK